MKTGHIADHLVHTYALLPESSLMWVEPRSSVHVLSRPMMCHPCGQTPARYETWASRFGCAPLLCTDCAHDYVDAPLGVGSVTLLLDLTEVPSDLRDLVNAVCDQLGREALFDITGGR